MEQKASEQMQFHQKIGPYRLIFYLKFFYLCSDLYVHKNRICETLEHKQTGKEKATENLEFIRVLQQLYMLT